MINHGSFAIQMTSFALILSLSCNGALNNESKESVLVLEIQRNTTLVDRDTTDDLVSLHATGELLFDINDIERKITIQPMPSGDYKASNPVILISVLEKRIYGDYIGGYGSGLHFHETIPTDIEMISFPSDEPDSLHLSSIDAEMIITLTYRDSSIVLTPHSNFVWIDSMYIQTHGGELFAVDTVEFINHGDLTIDLLEFE